MLECMRKLDNISVRTVYQWKRFPLGTESCTCDEMKVGSGSKIAKIQLKQ